MSSILILGSKKIGLLRTKGKKITQTHISKSAWAYVRSGIMASRSYLQRINTSFRLLIAFLALFVTMLCWSLSSPAPAGYDATYHLGNIWCAQGEKPNICEKIETINGQRFGLVPKTLVSGSESSDTALTLLASVASKSPFYSIMNFFVGENVTQSVLTLRAINGLITASLITALVFFSRGKMRIAVVSALTFTINPVIISTLWQPNPRSWGYLSVISGWAFLKMALNETIDTRRKIWLWTLFIISCLLAFLSRRDATLFLLFTCAVVTTTDLWKRNYLKTKYLLPVFGSSALIFYIVRSNSRILSSYTRFSFSEILSNNETIFVLVHLPENILDAFGLGLRYQELGPNSVGLIGVVLYFIALSSWLRNVSRTQIIPVALTSFFLFSVMFQIAYNWPENNEASGVYTAALLTVILGLSAANSELDIFFPLSITNRVMAIGLLSLAHALTVYARFESSVKESEIPNTYSDLSLSGGWWWNWSIGPNSIFALASTAFLIWLISIWSLIPATTKPLTSSAYS